MTRYWSPLWTYASSTVIQAFDTDVEVTQELEAMQFVLALDQNTRLAVSWSDLVQRRNGERTLAPTPLPKK